MCLCVSLSSLCLWAAVGGGMVGRSVGATILLSVHVAILAKKVDRCCRVSEPKGRMHEVHHYNTDLQDCSKCC